MLAVALFFVIIALGVVAFLLGRRDGYQNGWEDGYITGKNAGIRTWQQTMESRRGPDGQDAFLGIR